MSEARPIGACGIRYTIDPHGGGHRVDLDPMAYAVGEAFTISRGGDKWPTCMSREEAREVAALLLAFAEGTGS